jgi:hypothetical protein
MRYNYYFLLMLFCLIPGVIKAGQGNNESDAVTDSVTVKKCSDFKITGNGSSNQWTGTEWINLSPQEGAVSQYITRVKVLYSETGIYFLFSCADKKITSSMKADNLNLWEEDVVEVFLWPDESFPVYFEYELSPANYELPIIVPNKKGNFLGWLPWHYDGERKTQHMTKIIKENDGKGDAVSGWVAEFFIPFKLLTPLIQTPPVAGNKWRANMYRIDYDNGQVPFSWQKTETTFHEFNKFGTFIFR